MRKLDRGTTGSALVALLLACAGLGALAATPASASRGCPQAALKPQPALRAGAHPPAGAVLACVGQTPITGAQFAHWYAIERHIYKRLSAANLRSITLTNLAEIPAAEAEAREQHIVVTASDVQRAFEHDLRTRYRRPGSFQRRLKANGEARADFLVEERQDLLIKVLFRHLNQKLIDGFNAKWRARTACARAFADRDVCGLTAPFAAGPPAFGTPLGPDAIAIDPASDTVYVVTANSLVMIDGTTCNAAVTSGCAHPRTVVLPHTDPGGIAIDPATHTLYVAAAETDSIAVFDTRICNATVARCDRGTLLPLGRHVVPLQPLLDPATHTLYVIDDGIRTISVIDASTCNAMVRSGCPKRPARLRTADDFPQAIAVDGTTNTLYVADDNGYSVSLVDTRTCSALSASGCAARAPTLKLPGIANPIALAVDPSTNALYVSADTDELFAVDGATCNATVHSGCAHPRTVHVRESGRAIALDGPTHTAYFTGRFLGGAELLDIGTCNPANGAGCSRTPHLARTGSEPASLAIDERTRTVYVTNASGDSVSLIRADRCNATTTAGC